MTNLGLSGGNTHSWSSTTTNRSALVLVAIPWFRGVHWSPLPFFSPEIRTLNTIPTISFLGGEKGQRKLIQLCFLFWLSHDHSKVLPRSSWLLLYDSWLLWLPAWCHEATAPFSHAAGKRARIFVTTTFTLELQVAVFPRNSTDFTCGVLRIRSQGKQY